MSTINQHIPMLRLNTYWQQGLAKAVGVEHSDRMWALVPSLPLSSIDVLWMVQDAVPSGAAPPWDPSSASNSFFSAYSSLVPNIALTKAQFETIIGPSVSKAWYQYLQNLAPTPEPNQLPTTFRDWASLEAPSVANEGASALSRQLLIKSASAALTAYEGPNPLPVDFTSLLSQIEKDLSVSSEQSFHKDFPATEDAVGFSNNMEGVGLWTGSAPNDPCTKKFAASAVSVTVTFKHLLVVRSVPGVWYNSSLLSIAASEEGTPPWKPGSHGLWESFFGPAGILRQTVGFVIVVSGIRSVVTSDAVFDAGQRLRIRGNAPRGTWPLYLPGDCGVAFNHDKLSISQSTSTDVSVIIATEVNPSAS